MTGEGVSTGRYVLCRGMNSVEYYDYVHIELACPIVTAAAQVAVADALPVDGVDFLLGNDLAGARVFPSPVPVVEAQAGRVLASSYSVCAVTRSMASIAIEQWKSRRILGPTVMHTDYCKANLLRWMLP